MLQPAVDRPLQDCRFTDNWRIGNTDSWLFEFIGYEQIIAALTGRAYK